MGKANRAYSQQAPVIAIHSQQQSSTILPGIPDALWEELTEEADSYVRYVRQLKDLPPDSPLRARLENELIASISHLSAHATSLNESIDESMLSGARFEDLAFKALSSLEIFRSCQIIRDFEFQQGRSSFEINALARSPGVDYLIEIRSSAEHKAIERSRHQLSSSLSAYSRYRRSTGERVNVRGVLIVPPDGALQNLHDDGILLLQLDQEGKIQNEEVLANPHLPPSR